MSPASPDPTKGIAEELSRAGGRAYLVGGSVRDRLLGLASKDLDIEVHGLAPERVEQILSSFGEVICVGRAFGVYRIKGLDADFSLPRRDNKIGAGHRGFEVQIDPDLDLTEASRRRDLTINSMALDLVSGELLDPHGGQADLNAGVLRATDPASFAEDPLRGLRVAQFAARFDLRPDAQLISLCESLDLSELPGERILEEIRKLLLKGSLPSAGLSILEQTGQIRFFPELAALIEVPQDPEWHPEGDVWVHTLMVVDAAAVLRSETDQPEALMFGALCHDLGKAVTTVRERGRIRSPGHSEEGEPLVESLLGRMKAPHDLIRQVALLTRYHLLPYFLVREQATARAYRRLARRLWEASVSMAQLELVARADHLGRTTPEALAGTFPEGDEFLRRAEELRVEQEAPADVVLGRHLIARGLEPGPGFGPLLARCREVQDETGWTDPDRILDRVLSGSDGK